MVGGWGRLSAVLGKINKLQGRMREEARGELSAGSAVPSVQTEAGPRDYRP